MKKINILKKNEDFNRIIASIKPYKYKDYIIYKEKIDFFSAPKPLKVLILLEKLTFLC